MIQSACKSSFMHVFMLYADFSLYFGNSLEFSNNNFEIRIESKPMDHFFDPTFSYTLFPMNSFTLPICFSNYQELTYFPQNYSHQCFQQIKIAQPPLNRFTTEEQNPHDEEFKGQIEGNIDSQFLPNRMSNKKIANKNKGKKQKKGRNILSNIFRSFLKFVSSKQFFQNQFKKLKVRMNKQQFGQKLKQQLDSFQNYIKKQQIFEFLQKTADNGLEKQYNKIMRTSLMVYIKNYHVITIYNSRKIHSSFRRLHLKELHVFQKAVQELYSHANIVKDNFIADL